MRIYVADFYHGRKIRTNTVCARAAASAEPDYCLESFAYMNDRVLEELRKDKRTIFLDSGAYSMFTQGVDINLKEYANFIHDNKDIVHAAANVDVIGEGHEQETYNRQKELERMGVNVCPVHHVRDADIWLQRYLDEGYDYVCLGGMVPETTGYLKEWLDHVWRSYLTTPEGKPKVRVHGFGLTALELMFRYPWYSVDSTSWVQTANYGAVLLDYPRADGDVRTFKVDFSAQSEKRHSLNSWHFTKLKQCEQKSVLLRLQQLEAERLKKPDIEAQLQKETGYVQGYTPQCLKENYGWRDHFNIGYFNRAQHRGVDSIPTTVL